MRALRVALLLAAFCAGCCAATSEVHAIIVSTSRFWFNYRHSSNALAVYHAVRSLGLPDDRVLLYLADDHACDARNVLLSRIYNGDHERSLSLYPHDVEVDYAGADVSPESLLRAITGRHTAHTPSRQRLAVAGGGSSLSRTSTLLLYLTGHGGDGFMKFHDKEELTYPDLAGALAEAFSKGRYGRALVVVDTCQAASLAAALSPLSPSVLVISSSVVGQNSYATGHDSEIGLSLADAWTRVFHQLLAGSWYQLQEQEQAAAATAAAAGTGTGAGGGTGAGSRRPSPMTALLQQQAKHNTHTLLSADNALASLCGREHSSLPEAVQRACGLVEVEGKRGDAAAALLPLLPAAAAADAARAANGSAGVAAYPTLKLSALLPPDWRISSTVTAHSRLWVDQAVDQAATGPQPRAGADRKQPAKEEEDGMRTTAWTRSLLEREQLLDFLSSADSVSVHA